MTADDRDAVDGRTVCEDCGKQLPVWWGEPCPDCNGMVTDTPSEPA